MKLAVEYIIYFAPFKKTRVPSGVIIVVRFLESYNNPEKTGKGGIGEEGVTPVTSEMETRQ